MVVSEKDTVDGIVGLNYLRKMCSKNVTFDYINKKILLDNDIISTNSTTLIPDPIIKGQFLIEFYVNGVLELGEIDTGCNYFAYRKNILGEKMSDEERQSFLNFNNIETEMNTQQIFREIEIAGILYTNIEGLSSLDKNVQASNWGRRCFQTINGLGSPFLENHIIQMDFENMEFRIK